MRLEVILLAHCVCHCPVGRFGRHLSNIQRQVSVQSTVEFGSSRAFVGKECESARQSERPLTKVGGLRYENTRGEKRGGTDRRESILIHIR